MRFTILELFSVRDDLPNFHWKPWKDGVRTGQRQDPGCDEMLLHFAAESIPAWAARITSGTSSGFIYVVTGTIYVRINDEKSCAYHVDSIIRVRPGQIAYVAAFPRSEGIAFLFTEPGGLEELL